MDVSHSKRMWNEEVLNHMSSIPLYSQNSDLGRQNFSVIVRIVFENITFFQRQCGYIKTSNYGKVVVLSTSLHMISIFSRLSCGDVEFIVLYCLYFQAEDSRW